VINIPRTLNTPAGSPTNNFNINANSPVVAFDSGTPSPESGTGPVRFNTPAGSPTRNFNINANSPIVGF